MPPPTPPTSPNRGALLHGDRRPRRLLQTASTVFVVTESGPTPVVFAKAENDFPTRVIYEPDGDALKARIEGEINGRARSMEWNFRAAPLNTRCPA